jgi:hypothetical protein
MHEPGGMWRDGQFYCIVYFLHLLGLFYNTGKYRISKPSFILFHKCQVIWLRTNIINVAQKFFIHAPFWKPYPMNKAPDMCSIKIESANGPVILILSIYYACRLNDYIFINKYRSCIYFAAETNNKIAFVCHGL